MNYLDKFLDLNGRLKLDPEVLDLDAKLQSGGELNPQKQDTVKILGENVPEYFYTTNLGIEDFPALAPKVYSANVDKVASAVVEPEVKAREADKVKADEQRVRFENALLQQASQLQKPSSLRSSQDYMNKLSEQMRPVDGEFEPQKQDLLSLAVASLAPALAGLAVGGDAGYIAGGKGGEASQKFYAGLKEQEAKERAAMAEQKSKRMVGQSEAAKTGFQALKEAENIEYDKLKTYLDVTKQIYGERSKEAAQASLALNKYLEQVSGDFMEAPKDLATFVEKVEDRNAQAELQAQKDQAANERAKIAAQAAKARTAKSGIKDAAALRKEFNNRKEVKTFIDIESAYNSLRQTQASAAGDIKLIFNYMKILDPTSVVREGEFANAEKASGVPDYIRNLYNKALSGQRLTEKQRNDFKAQAGQAYQAQKQILDQVAAEYAGYARDYGIDPAQIIGGAKINQKVEKPAAETKDVNGVKYEKVEGGWKRVK